MLKLSAITQFCILSLKHQQKLRYGQKDERRTDTLLGNIRYGMVCIPAQLDTAFANGTPRLITLTVGANDMHWADYIKACLGLTCDTAENTATVAALRGAYQANLTSVLDSIKTRSGTGRLPQVVITGYYKPFSSACVSNSLTASEIKWFSDQTDLMNQTIKSVANAHSAYVTFAPLDFTGHDICSADPWIQRPGVDPAAFHPNAKGQDVMAKAITQALRLKQL